MYVSFSAGRGGDDRFERFEPVVLPTVLKLAVAAFLLDVRYTIRSLGVVYSVGILLTAHVATALTVPSLCALSTNGLRRARHGVFDVVARGLGGKLGASISVVFFFSSCLACTFLSNGVAREIAALLAPGSTIEDRWFDAAISSAHLLLITAVLLTRGSSFGSPEALTLALGVVCIGFFATSVATVPAPTFASDARRRARGNATSAAAATTPFLERLDAHLWGQGKTQRADMLLEGFSLLAGPCVATVVDAAPLPRRAGRPFLRGLLAASAAGFILQTAVVVAVGAFFSERGPASRLALVRAFAADAGRVGTAVISGLAGLTSVATAMAARAAARVVDSAAEGALFTRFLPLFEDGGETTVATTEAGDDKGGTWSPGVVVVWAVAQLLILLLTHDPLVRLLTVMALLCLVTINLTAFLLSVSGTPNFRPRFKLFSVVSTLTGALLALTLVFATEARLSLLAIALCGVVAAVYVPDSDGGNNNGDIVQALIFHGVRKFLLRLGPASGAGDMTHAQWRPSLLLLRPELDNQKHEALLFDWASVLKKGGLFVIGDAQMLPNATHEAALRCLRAKEELARLINAQKIKAFASVVAGSTRRDSCRTLVELSGLGPFSVTTIVIPSNDVLKAETMHIIRDCLASRKHVLLIRFWHRLPVAVVPSGLREQLGMPNASSNLSRERFLDAWLLPREWARTLDHDDGKDSWSARHSEPLMMMYSHITSLNARWAAHTRFRVIKICRDRKKMKEARLGLRRLLRLHRISATPMVVPLDADPHCATDAGHCRALNGLIREHSRREESGGGGGGGGGGQTTSACFMVLPAGLNESCVDLLCHGLPPTIMAAAGVRTD